MRSSFYYSGTYREIPGIIRKYINSHPDFISAQTAHRPRAVGDAIEAIIANKFSNLIGDWCEQYSSDFARRAMANIAYIDKEWFHTFVDVKTHRIDTNFNVPNLTSVKRLAELYESDNKGFSIMLIKYSIDITRVIVSDVLFTPIEFIDLKCLTIGALGWGQIQIKNSNDIRLVDQYSRKQWMLQLCDAMNEFYPNEISKIDKRIIRFKSIKDDWQSKSDIWIK